MARVNYNPGSNEVQPDATPPNDYQNVHATPDQFGAQIGQAAQKFGADALDLSQYWGKIQALDASNNAEKDASDLATHVRSLEGQDALDAQQSSLKSLDDIRQKYRGQLKSPEAQFQFDQSTTPFFNRFIRGQLDTHFVDQGKVVASKINTDSYNNALSMAATAGSDGNWQAVGPARERAGKAVMIDAQQKGLWNTPGAQDVADQKANAVWSTAIEARALTNPDDAWTQLQRPEMKTALGTNYDKVYSNVADQVRKSYISKAEELEATSPEQAKAFVQANQAKFFDSYGAVLKQVSASHVRAAGEALYANPTPGAAQPVAPTTPSAPQTPSARSSDWRSAAAAVGVTPAQMATMSPSEIQQFQQVADSQSGRATSSGRVGTGADALNATTANYAKDIPLSAGGTPASAGAYSTDDLFHAFHGQESGGGANTTTSIDNAHGDMQITPGTFATFAHPGERLDNPEDNKAVGRRILDYYRQKYNGDAARVATAYFSGEGNVAPAGSPTPWIQNRHDGQGTYVSQYVNGILHRLGAPSAAIAAVTPPPIGHGSLTASGPIARPGWEGASFPQDSSIPSPTPAAFPSPAAPPATPEISPEAQITIQAQQTYHDKLAAIDAADAPDDVKAAAGDVAKRRYEMAMAEAGLVTQQREARERAVSDDVLGTAAKGSVDDAYGRLKQYLNAHQIDYTYYDTMISVIAKRTGNPDPFSVGTKYKEFFDRILAPDGDPSKIGSVKPLLEAEANGQLTENGVKMLTEKMGQVKKSLNDYGFEKNNAAFIGEMKDKFIHENAYPGDKSVDKQGQEKYDDALIVYNSQYDAWRKARDEGKGPESFPLWDRKNFNAFMESQYPKAQRDKDRSGLEDQPAAPPGVYPQAFAKIVSAPPQGVSASDYAHDLTELNRNPTPMNRANFDQIYGPYNIRADNVLYQMNGGYRDRGPVNIPAAQPTREQQERAFQQSRGMAPTPVEAPRHYGRIVHRGVPVEPPIPAVQQEERNRIGSEDER